MPLNILQDDDAQKPKNPTAQIVQLSVVVLVIAVAAYLVLKFVMAFIWWIVGLLAIAVLAINYKLVWRIIGYIRSLYAKNAYLGVGATLGAFLVFTPFVGLLFLKTLWDFRNSDFLPFGKKKAANGQTIDISHEEVQQKNLIDPTSMQ